MGGNPLPWKPNQIGAAVTGQCTFASKRVAVLSTAWGEMAFTGELAGYFVAGESYDITAAPAGNSSSTVGDDSAGG